MCGGQTVEIVGNLRLPVGGDVILSMDRLEVARMEALVKEITKTLWAPPSNL